jgi:hypothetical protein
MPLPEPFKVILEPISWQGSASPEGELPLVGELQQLEIKTRKLKQIHFSDKLNVLLTVHNTISV